MTEEHCICERVCVLFRGSFKWLCGDPCPKDQCVCDTRINKQCAKTCNVVADLNAALLQCHTDKSALIQRCDLRDELDIKDLFRKEIGKWKEEDPLFMAYVYGQETEQRKIDYLKKEYGLKVLETFVDNIKSRCFHKFTWEDFFKEVEGIEEQIKHG